MNKMKSNTKQWYENAEEEERERHTERENECMKRQKKIM